ncbi:hypothetical protein [Rhizobium aegyptiacum]|uniref:hypothetical protein n=1 Tax=Rhizobium aegyptiacum TaxID=1764550 RepID=UPI0007E5A7DD|nr:hypothetical protein [Rhizobium aegyptiacum]
MRNLIVLVMVLAVFIGSILCNSVQPFMGVPLFFAWNIFSVFLMTAVMGLIYLLDAKNKSSK